jgi:hypothetical protein
MKKTAAIILLILGAISIFASNMLTAIYDARWVSGEVIDIPKGMQLTISNDISLSSGGSNVHIEKDTKIYPYYIAPSGTVNFYYNNDGTEMDLIVTWNDVKEEALLNELKEESSRRISEAQKPIIKRGAITGAVQAAVWLVIGALLFFMLSKKDKYNICNLFLILIPIIIILVETLIKPVYH